MSDIDSNILRKLQITLKSIKNDLVDPHWFANYLIIFKNYYSSDDDISNEQFQNFQNQIKNYIRFYTSSMRSISGITPNDIQNTEFITQFQQDLQSTLIDEYGSTWWNYEFSNVMRKLPFNILEVLSLFSKNKMADIFFSGLSTISYMNLSSIHTYIDSKILNNTLFPAEYSAKSQLNNLKEGYLPLIELYQSFSGFSKQRNKIALFQSHLRSVINTTRDLLANYPTPKLQQFIPSLVLNTYFLEETINDRFSEFKNTNEFLHHWTTELLTDNGELKSDINLGSGKLNSLINQSNYFIKSSDINFPLVHKQSLSKYQRNNEYWKKESRKFNLEEFRSFLLNFPKVYETYCKKFYGYETLIDPMLRSQYFHATLQKIKYIIDTFEPLNESLTLAKHLVEDFFTGLKSRQESINASELITLVYTFISQIKNTIQIDKQLELLQSINSIDDLSLFNDLKNYQKFLDNSFKFGKEFLKQLNNQKHSIFNYFNTLEKNILTERDDFLNWIRLKTLAINVYAENYSEIDSKVFMHQGHIYRKVMDNFLKQDIQTGAFQLVLNSDYNSAQQQLSFRYQKLRTSNFNSMNSQDIKDLLAEYNSPIGYFSRTNMKPLIDAIYLTNTISKLEYGNVTHLVFDTKAINFGITTNADNKFYLELSYENFDVYRHNTTIVFSIKLDMLLKSCKALVNLRHENPLYKGHITPTHFLLSNRVYGQHLPITFEPISPLYEPETFLKLDSEVIHSTRIQKNQKKYFNSLREFLISICIDQPGTYDQFTLKFDTVLSATLIDTTKDTNNSSDIESDIEFIKLDKPRSYTLNYDILYQFINSNIFRKATTISISLTDNTVVFIVNSGNNIRTTLHLTNITD